MPVMTPIVPNRPFIALSLASLYSATSALPVAILLWTIGVQSPQVALSQTALPPATQPAAVIGQPIPVALPAPSSFNLYRLGAGDAVGVVVQRFPDLNFQAVIDQDGNITTPLLGKVALQGLTIDQAQEKVRQA